MFFNGQPLQVAQLVPAATDESLAVVHLIARAGASGLAGARAGVSTLKLGAQAARSVSGETL